MRVGVSPFSGVCSRPALSSAEGYIRRSPSLPIPHTLGGRGKLPGSLRGVYLSATSRPFPLATRLPAGARQSSL